MHPEQVYGDAQNHQTRALAQRKFVRGNGVYSKLSRTGIKYFEECYGKRIISRIKEDWRSPVGRKTS